MNKFVRTLKLSGTYPNLSFYWEISNGSSIIEPDIVYIHNVTDYLSHTTYFKNRNQKVYACDNDGEIIDLRPIDINLDFLQQNDTLVKQPDMSLLENNKSISQKNIFESVDRRNEASLSMLKHEIMHTNSLNGFCLGDKEIVRVRVIKHNDKFFLIIHNPNNPNYAYELDTSSIKICTFNDLIYNDVNFSDLDDTDPDHLQLWCQELKENYDAEKITNGTPQCPQWLCKHMDENYYINITVKRIVFQMANLVNFKPTYRQYQDILLDISNKFLSICEKSINEHMYQYGINIFQEFIFKSWTINPDENDDIMENNNSTKYTEQDLITLINRLNSIIIKKSVKNIFTEKTLIKDLPLILNKMNSYLAVHDS